MISQRDIEFFAGNSVEIPFVFKLAEDDARPSLVKNRWASASLPRMNLTGSTLVFRAVWDGGSLRRQTGEPNFSITSPTMGEATLKLTTADTRLLAGASGDVKYELERRIDDEQITFLYGYIKARTWANDD